MDKNKKKSIPETSFDGIPNSNFWKRLWLFIVSPNMPTDDLENSNLKKYALKNLIASFFLTFGVVYFIEHLIPNLFKTNVSTIINPVYLSINIALQAVAFGIILSIASSVILLLKERKIHKIIFFQVIQVYTVLNLIITLLFWISLNRILNTGNINISINNIDYWLGGVIGLLVFILFFRLLFNPLWKYIKQYYSKYLALVFTILALSSTFWVNGYVYPYFSLNSDLIIKKQKACSQLYEIRNKK